MDFDTSRAANFQYGAIVCIIFTFVLTFAIARSFTVGFKHHMNGIWIAHPLYAAYATKVCIALSLVYVERAASINAEAVHACSKATWADDCRAEDQLSSPILHEKRGTTDA